MQPENQTTQTPKLPDQSETDTIQTLVPTKNIPALLSYYFGVFGLIPLLGLPFTFAALTLGVIGLNRTNKNPTPGAKGHATTGLVLAGIQLMVFIIFVILIFLNQA